MMRMPTDPGVTVVTGINPWNRYCVLMLATVNCVSGESRQPVLWVTRHRPAETRGYLVAGWPELNTDETGDVVLLCKDSVDPGELIPWISWIMQDMEDTPAAVIIDDCVWNKRMPASVMELADAWETFMDMWVWGARRPRLILEAKQRVPNGQGAEVATFFKRVPYIKATVWGTALLGMPSSKSPSSHKVELPDCLRPGYDPGKDTDLFE